MKYVRFPHSFDSRPLQLTRSTRAWATTTPRARPPHISPTPTFFLNLDMFKPLSEMLTAEK